MYQESANNKMSYESKTHTTKRNNQNVRSSSKEAVKELDTEKGETLTLRVIKEMGPCTRAMVEERAKLKPNYVTKYVSDLIKKGLVQESKAKAKCLISGRKKFWIKAVEHKAVQSKLF